MFLDRRDGLGDRRYRNRAFVSRHLLSWHQFSSPLQRTQNAWAGFIAGIDHVKSRRSPRFKLPVERALIEFLRSLQVVRIDRIMYDNRNSPRPPTEFNYQFGRRIAVQAFGRLA